MLRKCFKNDKNKVYLKRFLSDISDNKNIVKTHASTNKISDTDNILDKLTFYKLIDNSNISTSNKKVSINKLSNIQNKNLVYNKKIDNLKQFFGAPENNSNYLKYQFPFDINNIKRNDIIPLHYLKNRASNGFKPKNKRLSITNLLTKSWCELKFTYDLYSNVPRIKTKQILNGNKQHKFLEDSIYSTDEPSELLKKNLNIKRMDTLLESWCQSMFRILNLFNQGEAREIICHSFINNSNFNFVSDNSTHIDNYEDLFLNKNSNLPQNRQLVQISGIIDHLTLKRFSDKNNKNSTSFDTNKSDLIKLNIDPMNELNFDNLLNTIKNSIKNFNLASKDNSRNDNDYLKILLSDVKTRQFYSKPQQNSVIKTTKLQIMYYKFLLENLSKNITFSYYSLLRNAIDRGYDLDDPIPFEHILVYLIQYPFLHEDFTKMMNGEKFDFDSLNYSNSTLKNTNTGYDGSEYYVLISKDPSTEILQNFCLQKWAQPVTLRYFAYRLAGVYNLVYDLLSDDLNVEYYCQGENFYNLRFQYDQDELIKFNLNSNKYWFGKRNLEPFKPTLENFNTYCSSCEYKSDCLWRKNGLKSMQGLGTDLLKISNHDI